MRVSKGIIPPSEHGCGEKLWRRRNLRDVEPAWGVDWLRTNGDDTNGAAEEVMNLTDWGKRNAMALLGR